VIRRHVKGHLGRNCRVDEFDPDPALPELVELDALRVRVKVWRERIEIDGLMPFARVGSGGQTARQI